MVQIVHKTLVWLVLLMTIQLASSCVHRQRTISSRTPGLFDKQTGELKVKGRPVGEVRSAPDIYVKRKAIVIDELDSDNTTGSLFNLNDERNDLFSTAAPTNVGRYLTINIASNRIEKASQAAAGDPAKAIAETDDFDKELLAALPELTPATDSEALIKSFKVKIVHRYDNGDALVMTGRRSDSDESDNELTVRARIPYDRLITGEALSTADLTAVQWVESQGGEIIERHSSGWEDEYTLRFSGFDEAKSRLAMNLDDKRRQLDQVKQKLEQRIKTFGSERREMASQREDLLKDQQKEKEKVKLLEDKVTEQKEEIKDRDETIKSLRPEDKPGDEKDGASGN